MGNCCGKESSGDNFAGPGRTLGSNPAPQPAQPRAPLPSKITSTASGPGRPLGGGDGAGGGAGGSGASGGRARSAAARAAEERASKTNSAPKGKLGQALANERKETMSGTLQAASEDERRKREIQQGAEARNWN